MATGDVDGVAEELEKTSVVENEANLTFAGRGLKIDSHEDAADIVNALKSSRNVNSLDLKGNTLGVDAAMAIGDALKDHSGFKRALWSDLFTGRLKTEIPLALKCLCNGLMDAGSSLVELDLSDNALGPNGMNGIRDFLRSPCCYTLQELRLNNNGLGPDGGKMLADDLLSCHESSIEAGRPLALRVFVSGRGRLEDEGAIALSKVFRKMQSLEEVVMPQNGINHRGVAALAEALVLNRNLRHLNLSDNTFTEKGSIAMAKAVSSLKKLEVINFEDCLVRTEGAKLLADSVKGNHRKLKVLKLGGNEIRAPGALAVAEAMANKEELEIIDLNANQLGDEGIDMVRSMMEGIGRLDQLASLSEDEGTEDEDEGDEEGDENYSEVEPEEMEDGEEFSGCGLEIKGLGLTPRLGEIKQSSLEDAMSTMKL